MSIQKFVFSHILVEINPSRYHNILYLLTSRCRKIPFDYYLENNIGLPHKQQTSKAPYSQQKGRMKTSGPETYNCKANSL